jgi:hypothetical protein
MTTTTAVTVIAATWETLETALRARRPVLISYHGRPRLISVHALGWKNSRPMLLGYQTSDPTTATPAIDARHQWRCMYIDEIEHVAPADTQTKWATANSYNPSHPFNTIDHVTIAV